MPISTFLYISDIREWDDPNMSNYGKCLLDNAQDVSFSQCMFKGACYKVSVAKGMKINQTQLQGPKCLPGRDTMDSPVQGKSQPNLSEPNHASSQGLRGDIGRG